MHGSKYDMDVLLVQERVIRQIAEAIRQRGWQETALLFLEAGHPFAFLGSQLLWVAQPSLSWLVPRAEVSHVAHLLEDPKAVKKLVALLKADVGDPP